MKNKKNKRLRKSVPSLKRIRDDFMHFFQKYQDSLWGGDAAKLSVPIQIITIQDLIYKFHYDVTLKEFNEIVFQDEDLNQRIREFVANNFIHYASTNKMKEMLQEYKESNVVLEQNEFVIDEDNLGVYDNIRVQSDAPISLSMNLPSDLSSEESEHILKDVEKFQ